MQLRNPLVLISATALVMTGCRKSPTEAPEMGGPLGVTLQVARADTLRDVASASGTVVPSLAGDWIIYAPESARIVELPKKEGDAIAIGDVLVRFDIPSITQQVAAKELEVAEAQARLDRGKVDLDKLKDLADRGLIARNSYEASRAELSTSQTMLTQLTSQLATAKAEQTRATIKSRFAGKVVKVWHAEGDFVMGGSVDPVIEVMDPTSLQISVQLPIAQLARIVPGQTATIRAIAGDADLAGTVSFKPPTTDPNAPTGDVRITFNEPTTLEVNAPVSVEILLDQRSGAILVPIAAVQKDEISSYVMIAGADNRAHRREVRVGLTTRDFAQIVTGINPGERVIVGGVADVTDGSEITFTR